MEIKKNLSGTTTEECCICQGSGAKITYIPDKLSHIVKKVSDCPYCDGTGKVSITILDERTNTTVVEE